MIPTRDALTSAILKYAYETGTGIISVSLAKSAADAVLGLLSSAESEQRGDRCAAEDGRACRPAAFPGWCYTHNAAISAPVSPMPPLGDAAGSEDADLKALIEAGYEAAGNLRDADMFGFAKIVTRLTKALEARESPQQYPMKATEGMIQAGKRAAADYYDPMGTTLEFARATINAALSAAPRESPLPSPAETCEFVDGLNRACPEVLQVAMVCPTHGIKIGSKPAGPAPSVDVEHKDVRPPPNRVSEPSGRSEGTSRPSEEAHKTGTLPSVDVCAYPNPSGRKDGRPCGVSRADHRVPGDGLSPEAHHAFTPATVAPSPVDAMRECWAALEAGNLPDAVHSLALSVDVLFARLAALESPVDTMVSAADAFEKMRAARDTLRDALTLGELRRTMSAFMDAVIASHPACEDRKAK